LGGLDTRMFEVNHEVIEERTSDNLVKQGQAFFGEFLRQFRQGLEGKFSSRLLFTDFIPYHTDEYREQVALHRHREFSEELTEYFNSIAFSKFPSGFFPL
jgi:hypothetical protein